MGHRNGKPGSEAGPTADEDRTRAGSPVSGSESIHPDRDEDQDRRIRPPADAEGLPDRSGTDRDEDGEAGPDRFDAG